MTTYDPERAADDVLYVLTDQEDGIRQVYESLDITPPEGEQVAF